MFGRVSVVRSGSESISSKPQNVTFSPVTTNRSPRTLREGAPAPSITARSPRYGRTTTGAPGAPRTLLTNAPRYVPPRSQIVSPGATRPPPPPSAVAKPQGRPTVPSPALDPDGAT